MKIRLHHTFLICFLFAFAVVENVTAQDAGMSDVEIVDDRDKSENEKIIFSPGEAEVRYIPKAASPVAKDSIATQLGEFPSGKSKIDSGKPSSKQQGKEDNSILSFNFLYYIIQKYKLQDIID